MRMMKLFCNEEDLDELLSDLKGIAEMEDDDDDDDEELTEEDCEKIKEFLHDLVDGFVEHVLSEPKLKTCPICGSTSYVLKDEDSGKYMVTCGYCPIKTDPVFDTEEEAIEYWNGRE